MLRGLRSKEERVLFIFLRCFSCTFRSKCIWSVRSGALRRGPLLTRSRGYRLGLRVEEVCNPLAMRGKRDNLLRWRGWSFRACWLVWDYDSWGSGLADCRADLVICTDLQLDGYSPVTLAKSGALREVAGLNFCCLRKYSASLFVSDGRTLAGAAAAWAGLDVEACALKLSLRLNTSSKLFFGVAMVYRDMQMAIDGAR